MTAAVPAAETTPAPLSVRAAVGAMPVASSVTLADPSGRFFPLLAQLGCSLALSTDESRLMLLGAAGGQPSLRAIVLPRLRGLGAQGDWLVVGSESTALVFKSNASLAPVAPYAPETYDAVYVPRAQHFTGRCDIHDMAFVGGAIVAVNTRYSCVCRIDGSNSFTPIWKPPFITALRPEDRCHLNGMAIANGALRYVSMLAVSDQPSGWRDLFMNEGGVVMDTGGRVVAGGLSLPHSPRVIGGELLCLESGRGHLLRIDPENGKREVLARLPGFVHGLAEHRGVLFVGFSKLRSRRTEVLLPLETEGGDLKAGIAAIDARSFEVIALLEMTAGMHELYDLQVLPGVRRADLRSIEQWHEHHAIEMPGEAIWATEPEFPHAAGADADAEPSATDGGKR